ncbi:MAG: DUF3592 domain-containing protein [Planctomycetes bacterium]|nr:DUF3592 domain-containing protein [Planctomycetota bacterium]
MASSPFGRVVGGGISVLIGLGAFVYGVWSHHRTSAAGSWPTVQGVVDTSSVTSSYSRRSGTKYRCKVTYHYSVGSTPYTGDNVTPTGSTSESSSAANSRQAKYRPGGACTVHYDASEPFTSCLELGSTSEAWLMMGIGGVFAAIGIGSALKSILRP